MVEEVGFNDLRTAILRAFFCPTPKNGARRWREHVVDVRLHPLSFLVPRQRCLQDLQIDGIGFEHRFKPLLPQRPGRDRLCPGFGGVDRDRVPRQACDPAFNCERAHLVDARTCLSLRWVEDHSNAIRHAARAPQPTENTSNCSIRGLYRREKVVILRIVFLSHE